MMTVGDQPSSGMSLLELLNIYQDWETRFSESFHQQVFTMNDLKELMISMNFLEDKQRYLMENVLQAPPPPPPPPPPSDEENNATTSDEEDNTPPTDKEVNTATPPTDKEVNTATPPTDKEVNTATPPTDDEVNTATPPTSHKEVSPTPTPPMVQSATTSVLEARPVPTGDAAIPVPTTTTVPEAPPASSSSDSDTEETSVYQETDTDDDAEEDDIVDEEDDENEGSDVDKRKRKRGKRKVSSQRKQSRRQNEEDEEEEEKGNDDDDDDDDDQEHQILSQMSNHSNPRQYSLYIIWCYNKYYCKIGITSMEEEGFVKRYKTYIPHFVYWLYPLKEKSCTWKVARSYESVVHHELSKFLSFQITS
jgi:hypothetical protein